MTYTIKSNQYIPHKGETSPNGVRLAKTYYYIVNDQGKTISHKTGKPYRGKNLAHYKFNTHKDANDFMGRLYMQSIFECIQISATENHNLESLDY